MVNEQRNVTHRTHHTKSLKWRHEILNLKKRFSDLIRVRSLRLELYHTNWIRDVEGCGSHRNQLLGSNSTMS